MPKMYIQLCRCVQLLPFRTNRTHLKGEFYAIGALRKGSPDMPLIEDDLLLFLDIESISAVRLFNRVQFGDAVFHSHMYKSVSR